VKKKVKHINTNVTVKVDYPSVSLLKFVRELKAKKASKKAKLTPNT